MTVTATVNFRVDDPEQLADAGQLTAHELPFKVSVTGLKIVATKQG